MILATILLCEFPMCLSGQFAVSCLSLNCSECDLESRPRKDLRMTVCGMQKPKVFISWQNLLFAAGSSVGISLHVLY